MITEEEQLKKNTEHQKSMQQMQAIAAYLDSLMVEIDETTRKAKYSSFIYIAAWLVWVVAGFFGRPWDDIFQLVWVMSLCYDFYRSIQRARAFAEFRGAVKMLELLGMIPPPGEHSENKRHFWQEGIDIVKGWAIKKQKSKEEAFA